MEGLEQIYPNQNYYGLYLLKFAFDITFGDKFLFLHINERIIWKLNPDRFYSKLTHRPT